MGVRRSGCCCHPRCPATACLIPDRRTARCPIPFPPPRLPVLTIGVRTDTADECCGDAPKIDKTRRSTLTKLWRACGACQSWPAPGRQRFCAGEARKAMTGRLVKQATLVRQSSLHPIKKVIDDAAPCARHALALSVSEILTAWVPPDGAPYGSGASDRDDRQRRAKVDDRRRTCCPIQGIPIRAERRITCGNSVAATFPAGSYRPRVSDALTLNNWLWWEDRRRELFFLKAGRARGVFLSQLGAQVGVGKQGLLDRVDRLEALLRFDRPDEKLISGGPPGCTDCRSSPACRDALDRRAPR